MVVQTSDFAVDVLKAVRDLLRGRSGGRLHSQAACPSLGVEASQAHERRLTIGPSHRLVFVRFRFDKIFHSPR